MQHIFGSQYLNYVTWLGGLVSLSETFLLFCSSIHTVIAVDFFVMQKLQP